MWGPTGSAGPKKCLCLANIWERVDYGFRDGRTRQRQAVVVLICLSLSIQSGRFVWHIDGFSTTPALLYAAVLGNISKKKWEQ